MRLNLFLVLKQRVLVSVLVVVALERPLFPQVQELSVPIPPGVGHLVGLSQSLRSYWVMVFLGCGVIGFLQWDFSFALALPSSFNIVDRCTDTMMKTSNRFPHFVIIKLVLASGVFVFLVGVVGVLAINLISLMVHLRWVMLLSLGVSCSESILLLMLSNRVIFLVSWSSSTLGLILFDWCVRSLVLVISLLKGHAQVGFIQFVILGFTLQRTVLCGDVVFNSSSLNRVSLRIGVVTCSVKTASLEYG